MSIIITGSHKNNIGKTIISIKMAVELSRSGRSVLMIDLSSGKLKMSEYLNVNEDIIYDVVDVMQKTCTLEQGIIEIKENLYLLPCPRIPGKINKLNKESFINLLQSIENFDNVIIDADLLTSAYIDFSKIDNAITINNNDFSSIKEINFDKAISSKAANLIVIINKYNKKNAKKGKMMKSSDIEKLTNTTITSLIEENANYSDFCYEMIFDEKLLKIEINNIIKKLNL
ncbi:MAG: septum site-determining protein MinD [Tissierellia bacterium]|nr:septum site-determining protein MinD [Tissierellia bacterium]